MLPASSAPSSTSKTAWRRDVHFMATRECQLMAPTQPQFGAATYVHVLPGVQDGVHLGGQDQPRLAAHARDDVGQRDPWLLADRDAGDGDGHAGVLHGIGKDGVHGRMQRPKRCVQQALQHHRAVRTIERTTLGI